MKIWIGCDHAGYPMKLEVLAMLQEQGYTVEDMGCDGSRADYPEIAAAVGKEVAANPEDKGILICGTGIGMSIAANKIRGVRQHCVQTIFLQSIHGCIMMPILFAWVQERLAAVSHWNS